MARTGQTKANSAGAADSNHIYTAVREAWDLSRAATDAAKQASAGVASTRVAIMCDLASAAHAANWSPEVIAAAAKQLQDANNDKRLQKTVDNFTREIKRFCNPRVRQHVRAAFDLATEAWDNDKLSMTKAYARQYMFVTGTLVPLLEKGQQLPVDAAACVEMAKGTLTADRAATEAAKALADIAERLKRLNKAYKHSSVTNAAAALANVTAQSLLLAAENAKNVTAHREQMAAHSANGAAVEPMKAPATATATAPEPAQGVADIDALIAGFRALPDNAIAALIAKASSK